MNETNSMIFTLTFDLAGGSGTYEDVTAQASSYYQIPSASPFRVGYCFMGWRNCAGEIFLPGQDYWFNYGNDTLVAVWEPIGLTLTFDTNGSMDVYPPITGLETESIVLGNLPTRQGYYFSRWENSWGISFNAGDTYTFNYGNDTLTAKWCSVTVFDLDGGEGSFPDISGEEMTNTLIPEALPTKAGYSFVKWSSTKYGDMNPGDPYFFTGNDTLTAVWETAWYTLTYDLNQADAPESIESQEGQATTNILLSETVPAREGYTFVRWENTAGEKFQPGDPYFFGYHDDTLTAVWGYTVTLDFGDGRVETVKGGVGETLDVVPTKEGYALYGWQRPNGDICNPYTFDFGHENLAAVWGFSITYDTKNGNESFPTQVVLPGAMFTIPANAPTRDGYNFEFWTTNPQEPHSGIQYFPGNTVTCHENMTLYAAWTSGVTFDANGGSCDAFLYTGFDTDVYEIPTATREGCTLMKWVNSKGVEFAPNGSYPFIYGNDTLTAVWGYTVTLDASGGECETTTVTKPLGETLDVVPTRNGYNFNKWINSNGLEFESSADYEFIYGDDTLSAVWECTLTYNLNGGSGSFSSVTMLENESIVLDDEPTRTGRNFIGWTDKNGNTYDTYDTYVFNKGNDALTASWRLKTYAVYFDLQSTSNEGSFVQTKTHGSSLRLSSTIPTKDGYTFVNWKVSGKNKYYEAGDLYTSNASLVLEPQWAAIGNVTVQYDTGDVISGIASQEVESGAEIAITSEIPYKDGFNFMGWRMEGNGSGMQTYSRTMNVTDTTELLHRGDRVTVTENKKCCAEFGNEFTITYKDINGGIFYEQTEVCCSDINVCSEIPEAAGFEFVFWIDNRTGKMYLPGDPFTEHIDTTLISKWRGEGNLLSGAQLNRIPQDNRLEIGKTHKLIANAIPFHLVANTKWESSAPSIVSVDEDGEITALSVGEAVITAIVSQSNNPDTQYMASCTITVLRPNVEKILNNVMNCPTSIIPNNIKEACVETAKVMLNNDYEVAFVAGMLANMKQEGNTGMFESSNYSDQNRKLRIAPYLVYMDSEYRGENFYLNNYSGKTIMDVDVIEVYEMLKELEEISNYSWKLDGHTIGFGLGTNQWSFDRALELVEVYLELNNKSSTITLEQARRAEAIWIIRELKSKSIYRNIHPNWQKKFSDLNSIDAAYQAGYDLCDIYIRPYSETANIDRGDNAKLIYTVLIA